MSLAPHVEHQSLPFSVSRKRSPEAISVNDDTPTSSRPASRAHAQKRPRVKNLLERPRYVAVKEESIVLDINGKLEVDVMWPGKESMERGLLGGILKQGLGNRQLERANLKAGFNVLCFLGYTIEHLRHLSQVASLLGNLDAHVFGVSLSAPPPNSSPLPIIYDYTRSLTLHLGLMHPLGGGRQSLDAIVVLDWENRRRMILPVGWGTPTLSSPGIGWAPCRPGMGCSTQPAENTVQSAVGNCVKGVEWLAGESEREGGIVGEEDVDMDMEMEIEVEQGRAGL